MRGCGLGSTHSGAGCVIPFPEWCWLSVPCTTGSLFGYCVGMHGFGVLPSCSFDTRCPVHLLLHPLTARMNGWYRSPGPDQVRDQQREHREHQPVLPRCVALVVTFMHVSNVTRVVGAVLLQVSVGCELCSMSAGAVHARASFATKSAVSGQQIVTR